jgi:hypothetical protein
MELRRATEEEMRTQASKMFVDKFQFDVGPDESFKRMFNTFCTQCEVTLRSLKLIYQDKKVFPSIMKNETPMQLGMLMDQYNTTFLYVESFEAQIDSAFVR